ncbi:Zinc finger protein 18 [Plakobranchus ocellatus]|uniref:Zinc finger protein 18 n=1 Tax=Plakobranchus ocellatus TaxID=259542 RepID=A0AAV3YBM1_9GAST|nr:Zinc finger protein 18 [Plakobranchus ocellatus]
MNPAGGNTASAAQFELDHNLSVLAVHADKPFACHICGKGFLSHNGFLIHMKSHEGRKFMCSICDFRFFQKVHLKRHLNKVHKMAQCNYCGKLFILGNEYNRHVLHCTADPSNS